MKHLRYLLAAGFLLSLSPLSAEDLSTEEVTFFGNWRTDEESSQNTLEEELSLLDEEFDTFSDEIFSSSQKTPEETVIPVLEVVEITPPLFFSEPEQETVVVEEIAPLAPKIETISFEEPAIELATTETPEWIEAEVFSLSEGIPLEKFQEPEISFSAVEETIPFQEPAAVLNLQGPSYAGEPTLEKETMSVDLVGAFNGSPIIYTLLLILSVGAVAIWLYVFFSLDRLTKAPQAFSQTLQNKLMGNQFEEALLLCQQSDNLLSKMIASGIQSRKHGLSLMVDTMKAEGKRASVKFWQKIGMLNDIAIIAPMLGLLGTVLGMFYAFYNINRSLESISTLFDGLGVSVGTTVAGLVVAILALILHSIAKYKLVRALATVENEAHALAHLIDDKTTLYNRG